MTHHQRDQLAKAGQPVEWRPAIYTAKGLPWTRINLRVAGVALLVITSLVSGYIFGYQLATRQAIDNLKQANANRN